MLKGYRVLLIIFLMILIIQIPACIIVCLDDAGQIDSAKYQMMIDSSINLFAFPLRFIVSLETGYGPLIFVGNLILLFSLVFLISFVGRRLGRLGNPFLNSVTPK